MMEKIVESISIYLVFIFSQEYYLVLISLVLLKILVMVIISLKNNLATLYYIKI